MMPRYQGDVVAGLRHVARWIKSEPHDESCESLNGPGKMCDCGRVLCLEQVAHAIKSHKALQKPFLKR